MQDLTPVARCGQLARSVSGVRRLGHGADLLQEADAVVEAPTLDSLPALEANDVDDLHRELLTARRSAREKPTLVGSAHDSPGDDLIACADDVCDRDLEIGDGRPELRERVLDTPKPGPLVGLGVQLSRRSQRKAEESRGFWRSVRRNYRMVTGKTGCPRFTAGTGVLCACDALVVAARQIFQNLSGSCTVRA